MSEEPRSFSASPLVTADKVQGRAVVDRQGERLGAIKDIYIDKITGQVEFVSLAHGGVLGVGSKVHPLPWRILDFDPGRQAFVVDLDREFLKTSPAYELV